MEEVEINLLFPKWEKVCNVEEVAYTEVSEVTSVVACM